MQDNIVKSNEKYNIVIENFEGPMDLLLFLITKHKMNIFDISLSELTDKYVEYLDEMTEHNLEITSEFIVMAATLLDIKARRLLPELEPKEDEEDVVTEQDMINRIIEYKKYKEVSSIINDMYEKNFGSFSKPFEKIKYKEKTEYSGQPFDINEIFEIYSTMLQKNINKINKKADEIDKLAIYEKVTVKDKVAQIVNYLKKNDRMVFNSMFNLKKCNNIEVVTAFLGLLELSKLKQVFVKQEYLFSDINVEKNSKLNTNIDLSKITE
jgi:segregation and condensation protein A